MEHDDVLGRAMPGGPSPLRLGSSMSPIPPRVVQFSVPLARQEWQLPPIELDLAVQPRPLGSWLERVTAALREIVEAVRSFLAAILDAIRVAMPVLVLVSIDLAERQRYARRMEAHQHRTAGRPRSRRRPGRHR